MRERWPCGYDKMFWLYGSLYSTWAHNMQFISKVCFIVAQYHSARLQRWWVKVAGNIVYKLPSMVDIRPPPWAMGTQALVASGLPKLKCWLQWSTSTNLFAILIRHGGWFKHTKPAKGRFIRTVSQPATACFLKFYKGGTDKHMLQIEHVTPLLADHQTSRKETFGNFPF